MGDIDSVHESIVNITRYRYLTWRWFKCVDMTWERDMKGRIDDTFTRSNVPLMCHTFKVVEMKLPDVVDNPKYFFTSDRSDVDCTTSSVACEIDLMIHEKGGGNDRHVAKNFLKALGRCLTVNENVHLHKHVRFFLVWDGLGSIFQNGMESTRYYRNVVTAFRR